MPRLPRRLRPRLSTVALSLALGVLGSAAQPDTALADDAPSAEAISDVKRSEAKTHFEDGMKAYSEQRYGEAAEAFQRADALAPSAPLSFNIAMAFERLNNPSAALRWYRDYLRRSPRATNFADVHKRVQELADKVAERGVQQLSVLSTPDGATVLVDGQPAGMTPITLELAPGPHRIHAHLTGYRDQQSDITLAPREPQDVALRLEALPSSPNGPAPPTTSPLDARPVAAEPSRPFGIAPYIVLGAGAVGLASAFGFELARRDAESEARRAPQLTYRDHFDAMQSRQTTARVLVAAGGALLVTGGVLLVLNKPRQRAAEVALGCDAGGCRLLASGSFR